MIYKDHPARQLIREEVGRQFRIQQREADAFELFSAHHGIQIRGASHFRGPAATFQLDSTDTDLVIKQAARITFISDGRVLVIYGMDVIAEIPAGRMVEITCEQPTSLTLRATVGSSLPEEPLQVTDLVTPGTVMPAGVTTTGSWVTFTHPDAILYGEVIYFFTGLGAGTGTWRIDGLCPPAGNPLDLTGNLAVADNVIFSLRRAFTSVQLQHIFGARRAVFNMDVASTVTVTTLAMVWMPRARETGPYALYDPATITVQILADGVVE